MFNGERGWFNAGDLEEWALVQMKDPSGVRSKQDSC